MKANLLKYILVLSLLLNFSLLGAAGYTYYQQNRHQSAPLGYGVPGRVPVGSSSFHPHLFEALSLKPEQRKRFEQKATLFHETLQKKGQSVDQLRRSLFELMGADNPDSKAIETTIAKINRVQEDIQKMIVAHMLEFKAMLDEGQQKKFFDLIQGAMTRRQEIQCP
jgi:Spy/CpxP family protein refolding chaperone